MDNEKFVGQTIDRYRIVRHIARGGMADVYLAEDVDLRRKVALKIMLDTLATDSQFVQRFQREAQTVARMDHPNIVQIYAVGLTSIGPAAIQKPYIAMQFIDGGTLGDKLEQLARRGKLLKTEQALNIARQIAKALAMAHNANIIHRDLKPNNMLIRPDGKPALIDLGIAFVEDAAKLTQTDAIIGTPHYMSPEQVKGERLDGRSDLYSLGVVLYEILAGIRPFEADSSVAVLHQQVYEEPVPLSKRRPDLSPQVTAVVETCLRKEPSQRFQHAEALVTAIDQALQSEGVHGPNPGATQVLTHLNDSLLISRQQFVHTPTAERITSQRPIMPVWAIVTIAVLGTAVMLLFASRIFNKADDPPITPPLAVVQEVTAVRESAANSPTPIPPTLGPNKVEVTVPPIIAPPTAVPPTTIPATTVPPAPNKIIFQSNRDGDYEIYIMDGDGTNQIQLTHNEVDDRYPVASPDGAQTLFESFRDGNWEVYVMNVDGSQQRRLTNLSDSKDRLPTWSPDGRQAAFISDRNGDYDIYIMNADGSNVHQVTNTDLREGHMSWSVNDQLVYNAGTWEDSTWEIYTIDTNGQNQRQLTHNNISDWAPEWSPDGRFILYLTIISDNDPAIYLMDADGSDSRQLYNSQYYEWGADWSADGRQIIFTKDENDVANLYLMNADGSNVQQLTSRGSYPSWVK